MSCGSLPALYPRIKRTGGIEIYIFDKETNEPLSNIIVIHSVVKGEPENLFDATFSTIHENIFISDENGKINIPKKNISLMPFHFISGEYIYLNMNIDNEDIIKTDSLSRYFERFSYEAASSGIKNRVYFPNNNYYPAAIYLWDDLWDSSESKIIKQENDNEKANEAFAEYPLNINKKKKIKNIIIHLNKRNIEYKEIT